MAIVIDEEKHNAPRTFITGGAGSGKTHYIKHLLKDYLRTATTGVAALNLTEGGGEEALTINSVLGYSTSESLRLLINQTETRQKIWEKLRQIKAFYRGLVIDEISMMSAVDLDIIAGLCLEARLPLVVVGDFAQLPPVVPGAGRLVGEHYAFRAKCWPDFRNNTVILNRQERQKGDPAFAQALNLIRGGEETTAISLLEQGNAAFADGIDPDFPGMTLVYSNETRDRYNREQYEKLPGPETRFYRTPLVHPGYRWEDLDISDAAIPPQVSLKIGTKVMFTTNSWIRSADGNPKLEYANGDTGIVTCLGPVSAEVKRDRDGQLIPVKPFTRTIWDLLRPSPNREGKIVYPPKGEVTFMPLHPAWACTVHKAQGLTLDRVQIDVSDLCRSQTAALAYVAASRCRTAAGIRFARTLSFVDKAGARLVGIKEQLRGAIQASQTVLSHGYIHLQSC